MHRFVDRFAFGKGAEQGGPQVICKIVNLEKFFKVKRIHGQGGQISNGGRLDVFQFHAKQRAAEHIAKWPLIHPEFDFGCQFPKFLYLIEKQECFPLCKRFIGKEG